MNSAASSNLKNVLVREVERHKHVAQMDTVWGGIPHSFGNVKFERQISKTLPHGGGIQIGAGARRQILIVCISHTSNLLEAAKESNPAQSFHEAGPKIVALSENGSRHNQEQLVRGRHHKNAEWPKHPR